MYTGSPKMKFVGDVIQKLDADTQTRLVGHSYTFFARVTLPFTQ